MKVLIEIFEKVRSSTTGHEESLEKNYCRLDIRKYSFSQKKKYMNGTDYLQIV